MADQCQMPCSKKAKRSNGTAVHVPPLLSNIVKEASLGIDKDNDAQSVNDTIKNVQSKALRSLDSYINCLCIRMATQ